VLPVLSTVVLSFTTNKEQLRRWQWRRQFFLAVKYKGYTTMKCTLCRNNCDENSSFKMIPCKHIVCASCMVNSLIMKKRFELVSCVNCGVETTHHIHKALKVKHNGEKLNKNKDPFRHFGSLPIEEQKGRMLVSVIARPRTGSDVEKPLTLLAMIDDQDGAVDKNDEVELINILSLLRSFVLSGAMKKEKENENEDEETMSAFLWKRHVFADDRPATKYFYAFCMGGIDIEKDKKIAKGDREVRSRILANGMILDIVKKLVDKFKTMPFQRMLGQYCSTIPNSSKLQDLLSSVRLSVHRTTTRDHLATKAIELVQEGVSLDFKGFAALVVDNVDYTLTMGKDHWTHTMIEDNSEDDLRNDGAYEWDQNDGKLWDDLIEEEGGGEEGKEKLFSRVCDVNDRDWLRLSDYEITFIDTIKNCPDLPGANDCRALEEQEDWTGAGTTPMNLGVRLQAPSRSDRMKQSDVNNGLNPNEMDFYQRNRLILQPPYHSNLGELSTVMSITDAAVRAFDRWTPPADSNTKTLQGLIHAFCADGGPTYLFVEEKIAREAKGDHSYDKVEWFSMAFHLMINSIRNLNSKHSKQVYVAFTRRWRKTTQRLDWALACPDPKDIFNELYQYKVALTRNLCDNVDSADNRVIHDHAIARAKKYPIVHLILIHLKMTTIILMLKDSWRSGDHGDVPQYLTCLRYLIRLEASSNARHYLPMNIHFLKWYECASTCLKNIFEYYLFTKVTANGELMPGDLCMEKHVGDVRYMYGKRGFKNMAARFLTEVPRLNQIIGRYSNKFGDDLERERLPYNNRVYVHGEPYIKSYNYAQELNLFGDGPPNVVNYDDLINLNTNETMSSRILKTWSDSGERAKQKFMGNNPSLACYRTKQGQVKEDLVSDRIKYTSMDFDELTSLKLKITKEEILDELKLISAWMDDMDHDFLNIARCTNSSSKPVLIEALVEAREIYFKDNHDALEERIESCEHHEFEETLTTEGNRETEIENGERFYKLHPNASVRNSL
jgi:hypothetical protein